MLTLLTLVTFFNLVKFMQKIIFTICLCGFLPLLAAPGPSLEITTIEMQGSYQSTQRFPGKIQPLNYSKLSFEIPGKLSQVAVDIGDAVYAVGTPYDQGLDATVTRGIISSRRGKGMEQRLQTDVSISPGNSGGALLDEQGRWLGVVNAKLVAMDVDGIGFAIPVEALPRALRLKLE